MAFSNHVAFLFKSKNKINIIHSDSINNKVVEEDFATSKIIKAYLPIYFYPIIPNKKSIINWLTKTKIQTILT